MTPSHRMLGTNEALGIASIIETAISGGFNLDQDLKGRWHVFAACATTPDYDQIARQLETDLQG